MDRRALLAGIAALLVLVSVHSALAEYTISGAWVGGDPFAIAIDDEGRIWVGSSGSVCTPPGWNQSPDSFPGAILADWDGSVGAIVMDSGVVHRVQMFSGTLTIEIQATVSLPVPDPVQVVFTNPSIWIRTSGGDLWKYRPGQSPEWCMAPPLPGSVGVQADSWAATKAQYRQ